MKKLNYHLTFLIIAQFIISCSNDEGTITSETVDTIELEDNLNVTINYEFGETHEENTDCVWNNSTVNKISPNNTTITITRNGTIGFAFNMNEAVRSSSNQHTMYYKNPFS